MSEDIDKTKLQILSLGSMGGMFIGSLFTYFFHSSKTIISFSIIFFFSIWGIKQLYRNGIFS